MKKEAAFNNRLSVQPLHRNGHFYLYVILDTVLITFPLSNMNTHHPKPVLRAIQNTARCMSSSFASPAGESGSPKPRSTATPPTPGAFKKTFSDIEKLNKQVRQEKSRNDLLSDRVKITEEQLKSRDKQIAKLKENIFSLRTELNESAPKSDYDRLKSECERQRETVSQLKSGEKSISQENTELRDELKHSGKFIDELEQKLKSLESTGKKLAEVEEERDSLVNELRRFAEKLIQSEQLRKEEKETLEQFYKRQLEDLEELIPCKSSNFDVCAPLLSSPPNLVASQNKSSEGESLEESASATTL